jgi:TPR repeat protein
MNSVPYQAAKSIWAFCLYHYIPLSMMWQFLLMKRLVYHSSIIPYDSEKLLLLLMKRFLQGFAKKIPLLLNRQAKYAIKTLNFARAIERMKLSMQLCNYAMADTCADLLFHGLTGIEKNRYEAVEIADACAEAGNERCSCLIRIFSFRFEEEFKRREDTKVSTSQVVVKSPEHLRLERTRTYQQCSLKPYLNPYVYLRSPLIIDEACVCGYCVTLKAELFPKEHGADCFAFAKSGYPPAQYVFGTYNRYQDTSPHRFEIEKYWLLKSALQGYPKAIYQIAKNIFFGIGSDAAFVSKEEFSIAYKLFQYAKYAGHEEHVLVQGCDRFLEECKKNLSRKNLR